MSTFQDMYRGLNSVNRQTRILEAEMRMDASRGALIPRKQEKLEKLQEQQDAAMSNILEAMNQMAENDKKFLDSFSETNDRIKEELEKKKEEEKEAERKQAENIKETSLTDNTSGTIVDVVIPSTVVNGLPAAKDDSTANDGDARTNVSV